ncbi:glycerophosphodiester phosphodiesterase [Bacillus sp. R-CC1]
MADAPKLQGTEKLGESYYKINMGIDNANEALKRAYSAESSSSNANIIANQANNTAQEANNLSNNVQKQLDTIVAKGDSGPEAKQARIDTFGIEHDSLKGRADSDFQTNAKQIDFHNKRTFLHFNKTGIIAHRGAHINAPENTLKAIQSAGMLGYELVELDVQKTSDGSFILMHDTTVDRTTNGTGNVSALTLAQIKSLIIDQDYAGKSAEEIVRIPTFEEACRECSKWGLGINVDCSKMDWTDENIITVVHLLKKYSLWSSSFFVVDNKQARVRLTTLYPDANVTWLNVDSDPSVNIAECKNYLNAFVSYSNSVITENELYTYKNAGIPIFIYSSNTPDDVYKYFKYGVRFIETDTILPKGVY